MFETARTREAKEERHAIQQRAKSTRLKNKDIRLKKLIATANNEHRLSKKLQIESLMHAKAAGDALNRLFKIVGRQKWKSWLKANFKGSYETATVYRRIANKWNDPVVQDARNDGTLTSIKEVLEVVAKKRKVVVSDPLDQAEIDKLCKPTEEEELQQSIMLQIKGRIKRLKLPLLKAIEEHAQEIWAAALAEAKLHAAPPFIQHLRENLQNVEPDEDGWRDEEVDEPELPNEILEREAKDMVRMW